MILQDALETRERWGVFGGSRGWHVRFRPENWGSQGEPWGVFGRINMLSKAPE